MKIPQVPHHGFVHALPAATPTSSYLPAPATQQSLCRLAVEQTSITLTLLTRKAAAGYLGISPQTLAAWASNRRVDIPFVKIGRRVMYRHKDLDAFIAANIKGVAAKKEVLQ